MKDDPVGAELARLSEIERKRRLKKLMKNEIEPCKGCAELLSGGNVRCELMFDELCGKIGKSNSERERAYRLAVATYFLQHPWKLAVPVSALSHLGTICYLLAYPDEKLRNRSYVNWLRANCDDLKIPSVPNFRGKLTVATLFEDRTSQYSVAKIEAWAESVWNAYIEFQPLASRALTK